MFYCVRMEYCGVYTGDFWCDFKFHPIVIQSFFLGSGPEMDSVRKFDWIGLLCRREHSGTWTNRIQNWAG